MSNSNKIIHDNQANSESENNLITGLLSLGG